MKEIIALLKCKDKKAIEKAIMDMTAEEVDDFADRLHSIAKYLVNDTLKQLLIKQINDVNKRLTAIEKYQTKPGLKKSITGQDDDDESEDKIWPSVTEKLKGG